jgi:peptide-methionine (S)-S-oxide reductase
MDERRADRGADGGAGGAGNRPIRFWRLMATPPHLPPDGGPQDRFNGHYAVSGYAGGDKKTAEYEIVGTGTTGHAESAQVTFDPRVISYGRVVQIFFSVVHDPTELNRQGPDSGTQYRSVIFPANAGQADVAKAYIAQLDQAHAFKKAIVTRIEPGRAFYPAEAYHQDFLAQNPNYPYIVVNDLPKIEDLKHIFPDLYRAAPVLVAGMRSSK